MKIYILIIIFFLFLFNSCRSTTQLIKQDALLEQKIIILNLNEELPSDSKLLGKIKLGHDLRYKNCEFDTIIYQAKSEARKIGGNIVKITKYKPLDILNKSCHRIKANILKSNSLPSLLQNNNKQRYGNYVNLNIYRYHSKSGNILQYDLFLGDSLITRVKSGFKKTIRINKEGVYNLRVKRGFNTIPIDIKFGQNYYIKCSLKGKLVGSANLKIKLMEEKKGKAEFDFFKNN